MANTIDEDHRMAEALAVVASELAQAGQSDRALRIAGTISDPRFKAKSLAAAAAAFASTGDTAKALQLCKRAIEVADSSRYMADAIAAVASNLTQAGQLEQALDLAARIANDWHITGTLADITSAAAQTDSTPRTDRIVEQVLQVADTITGTPLRSRVLATVGRVLAEIGAPARAHQLIEQAIQLAATITNDQDKAKSLVSIGSALVKIGNADRFEHLMTQLSASPQVWRDLLPLWRETLRTEHSAPFVLLRKSMCHAPFSGTVAFNGSLALLLAHIEEHNDAAWMQIIRHCPQLQLDFLLMQ